MESVHEGSKKSGSHSFPQWSLLFEMAISSVERNFEIQCPLEGLVAIPKQQTPQGWPETDVFVRQEIPRRIKPFKLMEDGLVLRRSRKRSEAIVAMRKHPSVIISAGSALSLLIRFSHAARTAKGMGVASDLSKGIRVLDLRKSETVWL